jgi:alanine dehydrogenase
MRIGIPREIKAGEGRVALLPAHVQQLTSAGHTLVVEKNAGALSGGSDKDYSAAGASIVDNGSNVYAAAELIVKVKEILPPEYDYLRPEHIIFTNIHGAADRPQLGRLLEVGLVAIAAEETHEYGSPNSVLAGEVGAFEGVRLVLAPHGGTGRHFMRHFGAAPAFAVVIGLGGVGRGALRTLLGLGLTVVGLDISAAAQKEAALTWYDRGFSADTIERLSEYLGQADLVVNCVLWDKSRDDHLLTRVMLKQMKPRAVIVDISCDPAGAIETSRPTSWEDPVYEVEGIRHFCVDNIPGAVPVAASAGYANAILPFVQLIAANGALEACRRNRWLARGLTVANGVLTLEEAASVQNRPYTPVDEFLDIGTSG